MALIDPMLVGCSTQQAFIQRLKAPEEEKGWGRADQHTPEAETVLARARIILGRKDTDAQKTQALAKTVLGERGIPGA